MSTTIASKVRMSSQASSVPYSCSPLRSNVTGSCLAHQSPLHLADYHSHRQNLYELLGTTVSLTSITSCSMPRYACAQATREEQPLAWSRAGVGRPTSERLPGDVHEPRHSGADQAYPGHENLERCVAVDQGGGGGLEEVKASGKAVLVGSGLFCVSTLVCIAT